MRAAPSPTKKLYDERASAVMAAIAAKSIDKARFKVESFGLEKSIADNKSRKAGQKTSGRRGPELLISGCSSSAALAAHTGKRR